VEGIVPGQVGKLVKLAVKHGPKLVSAIGLLATFMKNNPGIPSWFRKQLDDVNKRVVRGMLDIVKDVASKLREHDRERSGADADRWIERADSIGHRVRLAEALPKASQKKTLAGLLSETEALLAELIDALARVGPPSTEESKDGASTAT
jgi:hypothetical protein